MNLEAILERNRLQKTALAEAIGVSRQVVHAWSTGEYLPSGRNVRALLDYLRQFEPNLTFDDLFAEPQKDSAARAS